MHLAVAVMYIYILKMYKVANKVAILHTKMYKMANKDILHTKMHKMANKATLHIM